MEINTTSKAVDTMIAQVKRIHLNNQSKQVVFTFRRRSLRELEKVVELTCGFQLARVPTEFLLVFISQIL